MTKRNSKHSSRTISSRTIRVLTERELAVSHGGAASLVGVDFGLLDTTRLELAKSIGGSGLVIPGLT